MYNRYIPQPDGSYRKNAIAETTRQAQRQEQRPAPSNPRQPEPRCPPQTPEPPQPCPAKEEPQRPCASRQECSTESFLRSLLPQGFDTGDLLVVLLLLLIAGDSGEHRGSALLTLALYFIL